MSGITISGDKELIRALKALPRLVARRCLRQSMRPAMKIVQAEAKKNAPEDTGLVKKAIKVRAMKRSSKFIGIDVQLGEGDFKGKTFYGSFLEYGTNDRTQKSGKFIGKVEPHHFMTDAYLDVGDDAKADAIRRLKALIEEANNK